MGRVLMHEIGLQHSFDAAHRVVGHQGGNGKCARLHGHTYTVEVELSAPTLDDTGFVVDFGVLKAVLDEWDHRTLLWERDPLIVADALVGGNGVRHHAGVVRLPFNPTSENMAAHLARRFHELIGRDEAQVRVTVRETAKSRASFVFPSAWPTRTREAERCGQCRGGCSC